MTPVPRSAKEISDLRSAAKDNVVSHGDALKEVHKAIAEAPCRCNKCWRALADLKCTYKGKNRPVLICNFCNRSGVMAARHLDWPTAEFLNMSSEEQANFWAGCADLQVENDKDVGLSYHKFRGYLKKEVCKVTIAEHKTTEGGSFNPLQVYANQGGTCTTR